MYKVMHFIKRKPHLTHAQFRDHFERSHAAMALRGKLIAAELVRALENRARS